jgi:hypothetical protein
MNLIVFNHLPRSWMSLWAQFIAFGKTTDRFNLHHIYLYTVIALLVNAFQFLINELLLIIFLSLR